MNLYSALIAILENVSYYDDADVLQKQEEVSLSYVSIRLHSIELTAWLDSWCYVAIFMDALFSSILPEHTVR